MQWLGLVVNGWGGHREEGIGFESEIKNEKRKKKSTYKKKVDLALLQIASLMILILVNTHLGR